MKQGKVHWEQHWLDHEGPVRSRLPGFRDHLGFVNYDLRLNSVPEIIEDPEGTLWITIPDMDEAILAMLQPEGFDSSEEPLPGLVKLMGVAAVLGNHGFVLNPNAQGGVRTFLLDRVNDREVLLTCIIDVIKQCASLAPQLRFTTPEGRLS